MSYPVDNDPRWIEASIQRERATADSYQADIIKAQAETIRILFEASRYLGGPSHPDAIIKAVTSGDLSILAEQYEPPRPATEAEVLIP